MYDVVALRLSGSLIAILARVNSVPLKCGIYFLYVALAVLTGLADTMLAIFSIIFAWISDFIKTAAGAQGHTIVASIIGAYVAAFGVILSLHEIQMTRHSMRISAFFTMVTSSNTASSTFALSQLGALARDKIVGEPHLFYPQNWLTASYPSLDDLKQWFAGYARLCKKDVCGSTTMRGDFSGIDLHGLSLPELDGHGIDFTNAEANYLKAEESDFSGAFLVDSDLNVSQLAGSSFSESILDGAYIELSDLGRIEYDENNGRPSNFENASLRGVKASCASFVGAHMAGADFRPRTVPEGKDYRWSMRREGLGTDLRMANFKFADVTNADFRGALIVGVDFREAKIEGAKFEGAIADETTLMPEGFDRSALREEPYWRQFWKSTMSCEERRKVNYLFPRRTYYYQFDQGRELSEIERYLDTYGPRRGSGRSILP